MNLMAEILRLIILFGMRLGEESRDLSDERAAEYHFFHEIEKEIKTG